MTDTPARILVVDDEPSITEFVSYNLRKEGYEVAVAADGDDALELAQTTPFDLVVLDVMLPGMDGYEVCRRLRADSSVPVLFLSARDTELDKVVGLEIGGDDYLAKPFGVRELTARVKALLRRAPAGSARAGHRGRAHRAGGHRARRGRARGHRRRPRPSTSPRASSNCSPASCATEARCSRATSCCARRGAGSTSSRPRRSTRT